jgi:hypothetical protein
LSAQTNNLYLHSRLPLGIPDSTAAERVRMKGSFTANRLFRRQIAGAVCASASFSLMFLISQDLYAQGMGGSSKRMSNPSNPPSMPAQPNFVHNPDGWAISAPITIQAAPENEKAVPTPSPCYEGKYRLPSDNSFLAWLEKWTFEVSMLYQFSNERSRVGEFSWDIDSIGADLTASFYDRPYTSLSLSYFYSHWNGRSSAGQNDTANQSIGSVRILQPFNNIWNSNWRPADQSDVRINHQLAILIETAYGGSIGRLTTANFASQHETIYSLVGDPLLDYQFSWFPERYVPKTLLVANLENLFPEEEKELLGYRDCDSYNYPNLIFEFTTGPQFSTVRIDSSGLGSPKTTSGRQFDYVNSAVLTGSLSSRWGLLVGVTWDAPFASQPVRGGKSDRANTATFTGGLVYNLFPSTAPHVRYRISDFWRRLSLSFLYSYTAFDPLTETNTIQVQASYSF